MTDTTISTSPIPLRSPPHLYEASKLVVTSDRQDRDSETRRTCKTCGLTKITVHGKAGQSFREWRYGEKGESFGGKDPLCKATVEQTA